ncbi:stevor PIR protein, putative [Plasmodium reichenowi]|uniref:Stevor PIR protein, putative n=1 Tax=Plasmodium reichenowi TaxID=5854 RepID=A0A2P9DCE2_PLARE|nr:stevor PIR protein, putative [Plasmodium reichenowi]
MKIYYVKMLIFTFLISTLVSPHNENYQNNHYNVSFIQNNTKWTTIKSRLLAQTQKHNPHYHNDPELKGIIDKLNEEAIKKYRQTNEPYEQLRELVEKKGTKLTGGNGAEPMSNTEKELFETYEEMFGDKNHVTLKSDRYPNDADEASYLSSCECTDTDNTKLAKTKGKDKYLKHLKQRCTRGVYFCSIGTAFLTLIGFIAAKKAAIAAVSTYAESIEACMSSVSLFHIFDSVPLTTAIKTSTTCSSVAFGAGDVAGTAAGAATTAIIPYSIAIYVLIAITVILIILYIWLYRRRKNSYKHECKKHLCK